MTAYEARLNSDPRWALSEGSRHFEDRSAVQDTLRKITRRLSDLGIPYAVSGGMALFHHGVRRFTEDVGILVTRDGLKSIHTSLSGQGYLQPTPGSKNLRDATTGVRVDFVVAGDFPGDGKPKPVSFPDPAGVAEEQDEIRYLSLTKLIELKLASGMTNPGRLRDLSDVLELIKTLQLGPAFADELNAYVRPKFLELVRAAASDSGPA
jgi:hypothetical protein